MVMAMKRLGFQNGPLDAVDLRILKSLTTDARVTMAELARQVGLSAPSVTERVRRLEEAGVIKGYAAIVEPAALGLPVSAWLRVRPVPGELARVAAILAALEAIVECDRITGEDCFLAKAHVESVAALEALIDRIAPYAMTNTSIIQSSPVPRRLPPVEAGA
jgi:Lrp/AsnC family leucine-responsive transcriptional regulator